MNQENQLYSKTIKLPHWLMEDYKRHAAKRNMAVSAFINNVLYEANKKLNSDDSNVSRAIPDPGKAG